MTDLKSPSFKIGKFWQIGTTTLVWQLLPSGLMRDKIAAKKIFIVVELVQNSSRISFTLEKPSATTSEAAMSNLLRKYASSTTLTQIIEDTESKDIWLELAKAGATELFYVQISHERPPEFRFINSASEVLLRMSSQGTYTKKKPFEGVFPAGIAHKRDRLSDFLKTLNSERTPDAQISENGLIGSAQKQLVAQLKRRLRTLKKSLNKTKSVTASQEDIELLEKQTGLMQQGETTDLPLALEPDLSVGQNLDQFFKKLKRAKKSNLLQTQRSAALAEQIDDLEATIARLQSTEEDEATLTRLRAKFSVVMAGAKSVPGKRQQAVHKPYRTFLSSEDFEILVGKGAKDNDELTKSAKGNDLWFHALGLAGSHIVVPVAKNFDPSKTQRTQHEAAILALHFSKARNNFTGEVCKTTKQFLKKKKGMPAGRWLVTKSTTTFVRYKESDIQSILARELK
jgi:predicted ribosome quality control (RQC) complex YloA/Tae2 family protein